jgi:ribosomal subunit interface protein
MNTECKARRPTGGAPLAATVQIGKRRKSRIIMETEPRIGFRGMDPSPAVEAAVRERISRLEQFHERITSCSVVIEAPHRHGRKGKLFEVRVEVVVPGATIVAARERGLNHAHEDIYVAIRDSFDAAQRQLEDVARKMSGHRVRPHPDKLHGVVARMFPEEGYGFIATSNGREYFFRRESMASDEDWRALAPGNEVRFTEHHGEKGPYASAILPA